MAEMSKEEEFATKVFQNLILPRGPVSSVKIRTFKKFLSEGDEPLKQNESIEVDEDQYITLVCQTTFDQVKNLKFECPKCDFEFKQIGGLTKHMSLLHPEPVVKLTIQENEIVELPSSPPLQKSEPTLIQYCVASDKILELKPPENEIIANLEPITVVKKCSKSLLKLKENSALDKPLPFQCVICKTSFNWSSSLKRHNTTIHNKKYFECLENHCHFKASQKKELLHHIVEKHRSRTSSKTLAPSSVLTSSHEIKKLNFESRKKHFQCFVSPCKYKSEKRADVFRHVATCHPGTRVLSAGIKPKTSRTY